MGWVLSHKTALAVLAAVIFIAGVPIIDQAQTLANRLGITTPRGQVGVSVASPSVHTRERLLNDRFQQVAWLEELLQQTRPSPAQPGTAGAGAPAPAPAVGTEPPRPDAVAGSSSTTQTRMRYGFDDPGRSFAINNGYRDVLRSERASAMLDDRHDIDGNTLYLLTFDTAVMPPPGSQGFAAVEALLTRNPADLEDVRTVPGGLDAQRRLGAFDYQDIFDIYVNWLEKLRALEKENVSFIERILGTPGASLPPMLSDLVPTMEYLACAALVTAHSVTAADPQQQQQACADAERGDRASWNSYDGPLKEIRDLERDHRAAFDKISEQLYQSAPVPFMSDYLDSLNSLIKTVQPGSNKVLNSQIARMREVIENPELAVLSYNDAGRLCSPDQEAPAFVVDTNLYDLLDHQPAGPPAWRHPPPLAGGATSPLPSPAAATSPPSVPSPPPVMNVVRRPCPRFYTPLEQARFLAWVIENPSHELRDKREAEMHDMQGGNHLGRLPDEAVSNSCIGARWLVAHATQATAGEPRNHGSSLTEFFRLWVRSTQDGACTVVVDPLAPTLRSADGVSFEAAAASGGATRVSTALRDPDAIERSHRTAIHIRTGTGWDDVLLAWTAQVPIRLKRSSGSVFETKILDQYADSPNSHAGTVVLANPLPAGDWRDAEISVMGEQASAWPATAGDGSSFALTAVTWLRLGTIDINPDSNWHKRLVVKPDTPPYSATKGIGGRSDIRDPWQDVVTGQVPVVVRRRSAASANTVLLVTPMQIGQGIYEIVLRDPVFGDLDDFSVVIPDAGHLLRHLQSLLEGPGYSGRDDTPMTQAFSYGLSPKLRQTVSGQVNRDDAAGGTFLGMALHLGGSVNTEIETTEPEVVGFNRPSLKEGHSISGARFGWLITPRPSPGSTGEWTLPIQQVQLGATVSVPSWWRSVLLEVCTKSMPRSRVQTVVDPEFWHENSRCHVEVLRLPGTAVDVSSHLGMDVLSYPYVTAEGDAVVYANDSSRPARILIKGERLWRSTVVTLGGQRASEIEVLPDMNGIIATFLCVDVPNIRTGPSRNVQADSAGGYDFFDVPIVVWTSEGKSEPLNATVGVAKDPAKMQGGACHAPISATGPSPASPAATSSAAQQ